MFNNERSVDVALLYGNDSKRISEVGQNTRRNQRSALQVKVSVFYSRYDSNSGGEREIQRTMLELLNQLDGFDSRGDVKVIMATNRIETLDPALIRPGWSERLLARLQQAVESVIFPTLISQSVFILRRLLCQIFTRWLILKSVK